MTRARQRKLTRKKPEVIEYFKFKGRLTAPAFIEVINEAGIEIEPHEGQWEIIDAYEERIPPSPAVLQMAAEHGLSIDFEYKYRCLIAACGRRFGKSVVASLLGAQEMLVPHARILIVSYTLDNCEVIFEMIRKIIVELLGHDEVVADRQKKRILDTVHVGTHTPDRVHVRIGVAAVRSGAFHVVQQVLRERFPGIPLAGSAVAFPDGFVGRGPAVTANLSDVRFRCR